MNINAVAHNLMAMNTQRSLGINTKNKADSMEKLSSGYKINRAADDAAGLSISEKMRKMIRGLNQGTENAQDGVSWIRIGDGSLEEVHSMLHRMTELTVKSMNGTWSMSDRAFMETEFKQLQTEINRTTNQSKFNDQHIFAKHASPFHRFEGNIEWLSGQKHQITDQINDLTITFKSNDSAAPQTATISIPPGQYTTKELIDEIDTAFENAGLLEQGIGIELTNSGTVNLYLEGGSAIHEARGGLSYLLYDIYEGGSTGALIGTTQFLTDTAKLPVVDGENNIIEFDIDSLDGTSIHKKIEVPQGRYTRDELIDFLNKELSDTSVVAVKYDRSIKLTSDDSIITGLKGNMFKVDDADSAVYTSIFYDNIGYETVTMIPASLSGGTVLSPTSYTQYHNIENTKYHINASNSELILQPNGSASAVTINLLDPGLSENDFSIYEMANKLNDEFQKAGLELTADTYADKSGYLGLKITSNVVGIESDIGIDPKSSAYNTLFVTRGENRLEIKADRVNTADANRGASYRSGKTYGSSDWPLSITSDNNAFTLTVNGEPHEIFIVENDYPNSTALAQAIRNGIALAAADLENRLGNSDLADAFRDVKVSMGSYIQLYTDADNSRVNTIRVSPYGQVNTGYADLFTTTISYTDQTAYGYGKITLNNPVTTFPVTINEDKKDLIISMNGTHKVTFPAPVTYQNLQEIEDAINAQLPSASRTETNKTFTEQNVTGQNNTVTCNPAKGSTTVLNLPASYVGKGDDGIIQGEVGDDSKATPAIVDIPLTYFPSGGLTLSEAKNIVITVNNVQKTITFASGTSFSSRSDFASKLQQKLNEAYQGGNAVKVSASGSNLHIETAEKGLGTVIDCLGTGSSLLSEINTQRTISSLTSNKTLKSSTTIAAGKNTFKFSYEGRSVELTLTPGNYTSRSAIIQEVNKQIDNYNSSLPDSQKINIRAATNSSYLRLESTVPGEPIEITYNLNDGGTVLTSLFNNAEKTPATATLNQPIAENIAIDSSNNQFSITVNGSQQTISLATEAGGAQKTYSRTELAAELNAKLSGVTVTLNTANQLVFTTADTGSNASLHIKYDTLGSSAKAIFGTSPVDHPGLKASFTSDGRLELTSVNVDGNPISAYKSVNANTSSIFHKAVKHPQTPVAGSSVDSHRATEHSCIQGAPLKGSTVTINRWNNELNFRYSYRGGSRYINVKLDEGTYAFDELQKILEDKLNKDVENDPDDNRKLKVDVTSDGVNIKASYPGSYYSMSVTESTAGGFYHNVLCQAPRQEQKTTPVEIKGGYGGDIYAVGRKDIRNKITEIDRGVNDTLTLDFTYGDQTEKITMTLDAGKYDGATLITHIQAKLNDQLVRKGLEPNTILASIGGVNTGVTGNNDHNALVFRLSNTVHLPKDNVEYKIDGIGGNAAFSVFYETDGDIKIAYVTGTKDISKGVTIPYDSSFSFDTDGSHYSITVPAGKYSTDAIIQELNKQFKAAGAPVMAKLEGKNLKLSHTKYGKHQITNIAGDAKRFLFFQENSSIEEQEIRILPSDNANDAITIEKPPVNTTYLGINTVMIETQKSAAKALRRLDGAVAAVSEVRSMFGATQNRLEHTIDSNNNTAENLQASESIIRDTDMSKEVLVTSQTSILEQVEQSILAQANQAKHDVLRLLQ